MREGKGEKQKIKCKGGNNEQWIKIRLETGWALDVDRNLEFIQVPWKSRTPEYVNKEEIWSDFYFLRDNTDGHGEWIG